MHPIQLHKRSFSIPVLFGASIVPLSPSSASKRWPACSRGRSVTIFKCRVRGSAKSNLCQHTTGHTHTHTHNDVVSACTTARIVTDYLINGDIQLFAKHTHMITSGQARLFRFSDTSAMSRQGCKKLICLFTRVSSERLSVSRKWTRPPKTAIEKLIEKSWLLD